MPTNNFKCVEGHVLQDVFYKAASPPQWKMCPECGKRAYPTWKKAFNKKRSLTDILGNDHDSHHPQFGTDITIESADHYRQLCKEYEMEEANDTWRGSRDWSRDKLEETKEKHKRERTLADVATDEQVEKAWGKL